MRGKCGNPRSSEDHVPVVSTVVGHFAFNIPNKKKKKTICGLQLGPTFLIFLIANIEQKQISWWSPRLLSVRLWHRSLFQGYQGFVHWTSLHYLSLSAPFYTMRLSDSLQQSHPWMFVNYPLQMLWLCKNVMLSMKDQNGPFVSSDYPLLTCCGNV